MTKDRLFFGVLLLLFSEYVESDIFYDVLSQVDPCEALCEKTYPTVTLGNAKHASCCSRGCRFFNLVHLVEDRDTVDLNATKDACQASCMEAYSHTKDRYACNNGCASMAKQKQAESMATQITWSVYVEDGNSVLMLQPVDFEPDDVLTDPGLRRQLELSWGLGGAGAGEDDRLPETHVRTLPVDKMGMKVNGMEGTNSPHSGDWLDCAARKAGVPRVVLAGVVVFAVLVAIWLCLAPDRRGSVEYVQTVGSESTPGVKDPFDCPPKYSLLVDEV